VFARGFKGWCERVSSQQRSSLGLKDYEPLNPFDLAKKLQIIVWGANEIPGFAPQYLHVLVRSDPDSWSAVTLNFLQHTLIILNPTHSKLRESSNISHELSHIIIGHEPARLDVSEDGFLLLSNYDKKQEEEANWLCGCLLLPREALIYIKRNKLNDEEVRTNYLVSQQMLTYRMQVSGVNEQFRRLGRKYY
jgi:IrrE N-terminal-like domain